MTAPLHPPCPKCQSTDTRKHGFLNTKAGKIQRYQCNPCATTFTPRAKVDSSQKDIGQYAQPTPGESPI